MAVSKIVAYGSRLGVALALALSLALGIAGYSAPASGGCGTAPIPCMPVS